MKDDAIWAIGLMSGSSLDGIDAAVLRTNGESIQEYGPSLTLAYSQGMHNRLHRAVYKQSPDLAVLERDITLLHAQAVKALLQQCTNLPIEVIGFHGQTVDHRPQEGISTQIGNGALLAQETGITVVNDFRRSDIALKGQGAPLVPLFHAALTPKSPKPVAVINIGGIANISWIDEQGKIAAFDTGPGNVLMNDWIKQHHPEKQYDEGGRHAAKGTVNAEILDYYLNHPYFSQPYPKSLDRNAFSLSPIAQLSLEDGAATLTELTARSIALAARYTPTPPKQWIFCGGGVHNTELVKRLRQNCGNVILSHELGWDNDGLEAQAFAYFAVRRLKNLPLTFPETTGCMRPVTGGAIHPV